MSASGVPSWCFKMSKRIGEDHDFPDVTNGSKGCEKQGRVVRPDKVFFNWFEGVEIGGNTSTNDGYSMIFQRRCWFTRNFSAGNSP